jgi:hypothetical protein
VKLPKEVTLKFKIPTEAELAEALKKVSQTLGASISELIKVEVVEEKPTEEKPAEQK